jgi:hypothetical protein
VSAMKSLNRIVIFMIGVAFGMADLAFAQHYGHEREARSPSRYSLVRGSNMHVGICRGISRRGRGHPFRQRQPRSLLFE